jgi:hypothetical protein
MAVAIITSTTAINTIDDQYHHGRAAFLSVAVCGSTRRF